MAMALTLRETAWAAHTAPEIRATGAADGSVLVVPVGSVEQHGHHLPVATDTLLADAVAHAGAERADVPVLVTPPVWSGFSPHHLSLGGTLSGEFDDLLAGLESVAATGLENGFDALCFVNGHGGNGPLIDAAVSTVGVDHPDVEVLGTTYFELAAEHTEAVRETATGGMAHGGEFETSLMAHLHPEHVGEGEATYLEEPYEAAGQDLQVGGPVTVYRPFESYSETGALGDVEAASAEKGERFFEGVVGELADLLRQAHERGR
jgi:creatinine amidohydrolase